MRHFATESGKSKGQFYTPAEVSRVIAKVIGISPENTKASTTAYDPTCGSGSLLLKVAAEAGKHITLEGQEKDVTTAGLARMNMILHDFPTANILSGNTLAAPKFKDGEQLRTYDYVVANPPFSDKTWTTGLTPAKRPLPALRLGRAAGQAGRLRLPAAHHPLDEERGQRRLHPAPRRALPRQCRGRHPPAARPLRLPQGHHRPARQPLLRHRHPRLHRRARQGERRRPQGRLHDRRLQGLHQGRQQEPPARAGHPPHRRHLHQAGRRSRATPAWCRSPRSPTRRTTSTSTCRATSTAPSRRTCRTSTAICAAASRSAISTRSARYWKVLPSVRAALFESAGRPGYCALKLPLAEVKPAIFGHAEFTAFQQTATQALRRLAQGHDAAPQRLRQGRPPQGADRDHRRGSARHVPPGAAARCLRRLSAPHGLLGRDHAGRLPT